MPNPYQTGGYASLIPHSAQPQTKAPQMQTFRPLGTGSPLGGMNDGSLQMRGGPMSYNQRGDGTNNPNAFRVGGPRLPTGMRLLDRAARHRDPHAISQLAGMEQQQMLQNQGQQFSAGQDETRLRYQMRRDEQQQQNFQTGRLDTQTMEQERYKQQMERDKLNFDQSQAAWNAQHAILNTDRNVEYLRNRTDTLTDEQRHMEQALETHPIKDPITGQIMQGHIMTGNGQQITREDPTQKQMMPPDIASHIAEMQAQGIQATYGKGGFNYAPARQSKEDFHIGSIPGPMMIDPITQKQIAGPSIPVRINKQTGKYTRLTEEQAAADAAKAAPAAADEPEWAIWLKQQTQAK